MGDHRRQLLEDEQDDEIGDGGRGIRTPEEPFGPLIDFESIAFVHSAIPPQDLG